MRRDTAHLIRECVREQRRLQVEDYELWILQAEINQRRQQIHRELSQLDNRSIAKKLRVTETAVRVEGNR